MRRFKLLILLFLSCIFIPNVNALDNNNLKKIKVYEIFNSKHGIIFKWNKDKNADGYILYRKENNGKYVVVEKITSNEIGLYMDKYPKNNNRYTYAVRSYSADKVSDFQANSITRLRVPTLNKVSVDRNGYAKVSVDKEKNITGYKIQIARDKAFTKIVKNVVVKSNKISKTKIKLKKGVIFYFRVYSYVDTKTGRNVSDWSNSKRQIYASTRQKSILTTSRNLVKSKNYTRTNLYNILRKKGYNHNEAMFGVNNCGRVLLDEEVVLFAGDSLTARYNLDKYYNYSDKKLYDSGVNGYRTTDLLNDFNNLINKYKANRIFLLIGINDFKSTTDGDTIYNNILNVINRIKKYNPNTKLYIQSLYPVNKNILPRERKNNDTIRYINTLLSTYCEENNLTYIDTYSKLVDSDGNLNSMYTVDGLHLNSLGYSVVTKNLLPYVNKR